MTSAVEPDGSADDPRALQLSRRVVRAFDRFTVRMRVLSDEAVLSDRSSASKDLAEEHIRDDGRRVELRYPDQSTELMRAETTAFRWSFDQLQRELTFVLDGLRSQHEGVEDLLDYVQMPMEDLVGHYGSLTAAVDQLVRIRRSLPSEERENGAIDSWLVSVINETERFLREVVGLCTLNLGRYDLHQVVKDCLDTDALQVPKIDLSLLVDREGTAQVLADVVTRFMAEGSRETTDFCRVFADALGFDMFEQRGFRPGVLDEARRFFLSPAPSKKGKRITTEAAWDELLALRKEILHRTATTLQPQHTEGVRTRFHDLHVGDRRSLLDFMTALGLAFGIRAMNGVLARLSDQDLALKLRNKWGTEVRVIVHDLLNSRRFGVAWAVATAGLEIEPPDSPATILKLSRFQAQKSMNSPSFKKTEVRKLVTPDPRHELYKLALLEEIDETKCVALLNAVHESSNMSIEELSSWVAYAPLRDAPWWAAWYANATSEPWPSQ